MFKEQAKTLVKYKLTLYYDSNLNLNIIKLYKLKERGIYKDLKIIVGKGNHSINHQPKLGGAVIKYLKESNINYHFDSNNTGIIIASLKHFYL